MDIPYKISLDGEWDFYYSPQKFIPFESELPDAELFTGRMVTPGYWDDHYELFDEEDFFSLKARFNPDYRKVHFPMGTTLLPHAASSFLIGSGFYRKQIIADIPSDKRIKIHVGPAMWGVAVYCNRKFAGSFSGYSTATEFDITEFFCGNEANEIIIVVCNVHDDGGAYCRVDGSHDGIPFGTRPGQHRGLAAQGYQSERGGIGEKVELEVCGSSYIKDAFCSFENEKIHCHAQLFNGIGKTLRVSIAGSCTGIECASDCIDFELDDVNIERWSDREPKLYDVKFELSDNGKNTSELIFKWGARKLDCTANRILVNGEITYFRGVTEHCYFADTCNPHFDRERYLRELGVLRKAGFNFIRCHTWCPPEAFYEACDELGIYVQTELPSVYSFEEAEAIIRQIRRHACAVIFCEGNEKAISDNVLERIRKVAVLVKQMAPGMLFCPQEAMRLVEYGFEEGQKLEKIPVLHDAAKLSRIAEFSDVYGCLSGGLFSYTHDLFPGPENMDYRLSHYQKPCLSHEIGILGGYLDFELEKRYEDTFIGTDMFVAARKNMQRHGVWQNWKKYYENNSLFIASVRKQLFENIRSCNALTGYDFLGGIDTHWHLIGYPCGIFNEFYEEKYGETISDVLRYNNESILICSALKRRNFFCGTEFSEKIILSYFGRGEGKIEGKWDFSVNGKSIASGSFGCDNIACGTVSDVCQMNFELPEFSCGKHCVLHAEALLNGEKIENRWDLWVFPAADVAETPNVIECEKLTDELIDFAVDGGAILLTGNFPSEMREESFRTHTSGRSLGHSGALINEHAIWKNFPHASFADWQFFPMMNGAESIIYDCDMPEYKPIFELIPSFKLIKHKSLLSEFAVGRGRIVMCGLKLQQNDPAGAFLKVQIKKYLAGGIFADAPEWDAADLKKRVEAGPFKRRKEVAIDGGGRPVE